MWVSGCSSIDISSEMIWLSSRPDARPLMFCTGTPLAVKLPEVTDEEEEEELVLTVGVLSRSLPALVDQQAAA